MDPNRIQSTIQTLANFSARHTASDTKSPRRGIAAAGTWLLNEMTKLAKSSYGLMNVSMPCYFQAASPAHGMPIAAQVDFTGDAPGADDNASAVAIALEMVRILAPVVSKTPPAARIIIAAVAGEEQGLYGSNLLAQTLKNASVNVQANFNDDIVGSVFGAGTDYLTINSSIIKEIITTGYQDDTPSRHLGRYIQEVNAGASQVTQMDVALIYKLDRFFRGGDHESFLSAGFPAGRFTEPQENFYHQHQDPRVQDNVRYGDEIEYADIEYTAIVGKMNLLTLWSIANAPATPSNFTYDTSIGFLASSLDTPPSYLGNIIQLYWDVENNPLSDYYEVVWRPMASQQISNRAGIVVGFNSSNLTVCLVHFPVKLECRDHVQ
ncbi:hypothetical protein DL95DRAFT_429439 [Leptodontidium sp. 2 PMI_412]|nr:hypothetical protein DL95DRAFT_429439 [Leptodontidium sp. 2 PMI_412]